MLTRDPGGNAGNNRHCLLFYDKERRIVYVVNNEGKDVRDILYEAVKGIEFGSVTVHIQDGKIVYIEKTEKIKVKG